jgi:ribonuclease BN (tRNA processing enzyme)
VLGSGSGGNCAVLRFAGRALLIDAGFGPQTTDHRLRQARIDPRQIEAICLTHLDRDHCRPNWLAAALERGIRIHLHHWHMPELYALPTGPELFEAGLVQPIDDTPFAPFPRSPAVVVSAIRVQHDLQGTLAYRFEAGGAAIGYATDLGHAPPRLIEQLQGVEVLGLEANYDPERTTQSPRPAFVNRRNMSRSGHLSNPQALTAAKKIEAASPQGRPEHLVLLHRSRQCNHPTTLRRTFAADPLLVRRITLTDQRRRSRWIEARALPPLRRRQLRLGHYNDA